MLFTSEQVSCGHPDKICDQISDAILTECLRTDPTSRVAAECMIKDYHVIIAGEITSDAQPDYEAIVRSVLERIGLENVDRYEIENYISKQSPDIALGVDKDGAGDQGMMFGYATNETLELLPMPYVLATSALMRLREKGYPELCADAKSQVTYDYDKKRIDTFLISTQHKEYISLMRVLDLVTKVMDETAEAYGCNTDFKVLVNPTGRFVVGSSFGDSGLTGRKIIADTYGGMCRHGGGAFSGKDPTKVDRSAAYMARKIARDVVSYGWADKCEIQLAYAIGVAEPVSISVDCFGTDYINKNDILYMIKSTYDLTPNGIIDTLGLRKVDYNNTSSYGHFGKSVLPWEH